MWTVINKQNWENLGNKVGGSEKKDADFIILCSRETKIILKLKQSSSEENTLEIESNISQIITTSILSSAIYKYL